MRLHPRSGGRVRVVVAGGGVAGLEALIGLRTLAGERVELELIAPERTFAWRPLSVAAAFGSGQGPRIEIAQLANMIGARSTTDALVSVHHATGELTLASDARRSYDVLVVATGTRPEEAIPGAVTFGAPRGTERFRKVLAQAEAAELSRLVFAIPAAAGWPLALYELALLTAQQLRAASASVEITLLTPEPARWRPSADVRAAPCSRSSRTTASTSSPACDPRRLPSASCWQALARSG